MSRKAQFASWSLRSLVASASLAVAATANAQVEWFQGPGASNVGAMAQASGHETHEPCTFGVVNPPNPLTAWFKQFSHCTDSFKTLPTGGLLPNRGWFIANHTDGYARFVHPQTAQESRMASIAQQSAEFNPDSLLVDATTATRYSGQIRVANRAIPSAWGEVLFRVPMQLQTTLAFDGTLSWTGSASSWSGSFQVISVPNTGAPGTAVVNFGYDPSYVRQGAASGTISRAVTLQGGVYRLKWHVGHDAFDGPKSDGEATLKMNLKFTDDIACEDAFGPAELRWPVDSGYTAKILRAETEEYRDAPECTVDDPTACWKQRKVLFKIQKGERTTGPYVGWAYVPGTLRRHKDYPLSCKEIDPRYNCHGYMFAGAMLWVEEAAVRGILADWCQRANLSAESQGDAWRPGEVRLWRVLVLGQYETPERKTKFASEFYRASDHSQMMTPVRNVLDEKLGAMAYLKPDRLLDETRAEGFAEHYRCNF